MYPILKCQQSKVLTPVIYGIPEPAFLIQLADGSSSESLNLERIKSTCGQKLIFKITKGEEYIYIDGTIVDFSGAKEVDRLKLLLLILIWLGNLMFFLLTMLQIYLMSTISCSQVFV